MGHKRADLIQHGNAGDDGQKYQKGRHRNIAAEHAAQQDNRPNARGGFLYDPVAMRFALGRTAAEGGIDCKARISFHHNLAKRGNEQRKRRKHRVAEQQRQGCEQRGEYEQG